MYPSTFLPLLLLPLTSARQLDETPSYTSGAEIQIQCLNRTL